LRNRFAHNLALTVCEPRLIILPISEGTGWEEKLSAHWMPCQCWQAERFCERRFADWARSPSLL
jgi:hypothetical protein